MDGVGSTEALGPEISRRKLLGAAAAGTVVAGTASVIGLGAPGLAGAASSGYLVGAGRADMTGAVAGQGMMGYSQPQQIAEGLHMRYWARAFIIVDSATGNRVVFVTADSACLFESIHLGVLRALRKRYGALYTEANVNLNATHNHNSCGGTAWDYAYSLAAFGFKKNSYDAEVSGIVDAIVRAHDSLAPGTISLGRSELHNASAQRSRAAFDLNPPEDKEVFPGAVDPAVTVLRLAQAGNDIGVITWFSTHGTSIADHNRLITVDNKGYASHRWESDEPGVVAAFPQTNAGDMSPNLNLVPFSPSGPTKDNRANCAIIGERQYQAGRAALADSSAMTRAGVDSVIHYVDFSDVAIDGSYTPDGKAARTSPAMMGAGAVATSTEDNFEQPLPFFYEGQVNPLVAALGGLDAPVSPWIRDVQAPKLVAVPLGLLPPWPYIPQVMPVQIMRIGDLVLAAAPAEFTIVSGLRVRRVVADALRVPLDNVLLQGFANGYSQYVTTPEEYVSQQYEGGETQFGRWTLPAYMQSFDKLASALARGTDLGHGPAPLDKSSIQPDLVPPPPPDAPVAGRRFGDVITAPKSAYRAGESAVAEFVGAHPNNNLRRSDTYLEVEQRSGDGWTRVFDDNSWSTELHWSRPVGSVDASIIKVLWAIPVGTAGTFRIRYFGDWKNPAGKVTGFTGTSRAFEVTA
ncbi:neutral/alkaline ceramidase [Williamsia sp. 1135]|uniref:neutral/alkaline ceramidase n=1 Tax=Williamsia sp. 1135 TaxID=1889262 RepID=UPI000A119CDE|nr:neutral/alkaline ceramidase [Williamsia sp. 1135]ORM28715.1 alkaline ceramidase [Williamsia sp. 1135]